MTERRSVSSHFVSQPDVAVPTRLEPRGIALYRLAVALLLCLKTVCQADQPTALQPNALPSVTYTNAHVRTVPWSIHVVRLQRNSALYEIDSIHAGGKAIGLETLSEQLTRPAPALGIAVAGLNGDFYQRDKTFAGAPRGVQIISGELISAPCGGATFWLDAVGQCHTTNVASRFRVTWPNGVTTGFGLNGELPPEGIELYTPAIGSSTHSAGGRELVLTRVEGSRWLPLRIGQNYVARVSEIRETGNTSLTPDTLVLSLTAAALTKLPSTQVGMLLRLSTETEPALHGVRAAIGGGPILIQGGKRQKVRASSSEAYEFSSMLERHPRSAIGWNSSYFFLVEVDGRQKALSVGMTLDELTKFFEDLGCDNALNLDGGGSATLWYAGQVQNSPCDRAEREIANGIGIFKKRIDSGTAGAHNP